MSVPNSRTYFTYCLFCQNIKALPYSIAAVIAMVYDIEAKGDDECEPVGSFIHSVPLMKQIENTHIINFYFILMWAIVTCPFL